MTITINDITRRSTRYIMDEDTFNAAIALENSIDKQVIVRVRTPVWSTYESNIRAGSELFDVAYNNDNLIIRAAIVGTDLAVDHIYNENFIDAPASTNVGWTYQGAQATNVKAVAPVVRFYGGFWYIYYVNSSDKIHFISSPDGTTWSDGYSLMTVGMPDIKYIFISESLSVAYFFANHNGFASDMGTLDLWTLPINGSPAGIAQSGLYWIHEVLGADMCSIQDLPPLDIDYNIDVDSPSYNADVLVMDSFLPSLYTYSSSPENQTPAITIEPRGGAVSFRLRGNGVFTTVSDHYEIDTYQKASSVQYRKKGKVTKVRQETSVTPPRHVLHHICLGSEGEVNADGTASEVSKIFHYYSTDGKSWSQANMYNNLYSGFTQSGLKLIVGRCFTYLIGSKVTMRSPGTYMFGNTNVDYERYLTDYVVNYQSSASDGRQTGLDLEDRTGDIESFFAIPASFNVEYFFGINGTGLILVSTEEVDSIDHIYAQPVNAYHITGRSMMARITDKVEASTPVQYDNIISARDNYLELVAGQKDTGLAHTASIRGTWNTENGYLKLTTGLQDADFQVDNIAFSTFSTNLENGTVSAVFELPKKIYTSGTKECSAGVVFRAVDKDNNLAWYVYRHLDFTTPSNSWVHCELALIAQSNLYVIQSYTVNDTSWGTQWKTFIDAVKNGTPFALRADFRYGLVRCWAGIPDQGYPFTSLNGDLIGVSWIYLDPMTSGGPLYTVLPGWKYTTDTGAEKIIPASGYTGVMGFAESEDIPPPPPPPPSDGYDWTIVCDFLVSDQNWNSTDHGQAHYSLGTGWSTEGYGQLCEIETILRNNSSTQETQVLYGEFTYFNTTPVADPAAFTNQLHLGGVTHSGVLVGVIKTETFTLTNTISTMNFIGFKARCNGYDSGGYTKIMKVKISGSGPKPVLERPA